MIRLALEQQGFEVIEAVDSADGSDQARKFLPDLILCDVNMGKSGSGYTTLTKLREDAATRRDPVHPDDGHGRFRRHAARHGTRRGRLSAQAVQGGRALRRRERAAAQGQNRPRRRRAKLTTLRTHISMMMPHELRTPLNGIISNAEMIATRRGDARHGGHRRNGAGNRAVRPAP